MDWTAIGIAAAAILGPFLTKGGEAIATKAGADLYSWLKQRFEKEQDDDANAALTQLERKPNSKPRRESLAEVLTKRAVSDPDGFGAELQSRIQQVAAMEGSMGMHIGQIIAGNVRMPNKTSGHSSSK